LKSSLPKHTVKNHVNQNDLIALLKADSEKPPYPFNTLEVSFAWTSVFGRFMLHGTHQDTLSTTPARLSFNVRAGSGLCS